MGKQSQASTATNLNQRLMNQTPPPCSPASDVGEGSMGGWRPGFGGLCTLGSAVHPGVCCVPAFPADLYLSEHRGLLCPGWSQSGVSGAAPVCVYLLQSGCCRTRTETSRFPGRSTGQRCRCRHLPLPAGDSCHAEQDQCLLISITYSKNYLNYPHGANAPPKLRISGAFRLGGWKSSWTRR